MEPEEYRVLVSQGAKLLDVKVPGWRERVNVDALDMFDPCKCVLGQLFEAYSIGLKWLMLNRQSRMVYGFDASEPPGTKGMVEEYGKLTRAWQRELVA